MAKHIALLTAGHLSSCPRLLKEAELLSANGFNISIVYLNSISRIAELDQHIIDRNTNWNFCEVKWNNSISSIASKLLFFVSKLFKFNSIYLQSTSKKLIDKIISIKADFYIAHHPSVLAAAALAAKKYSAKFGYDIEDAFPFVEDNSFENSPNVSILNIEKKFISDASIITTASPLYTQLYSKLYQLRAPVLNLLNVFDIVEDEMEYIDRQDLQKVSFYWHSQTVGLNRGLQDLFNAINMLDPNKFELHIRGVCSNEIKMELLNLIKFDSHKCSVFFHSIVSTEELAKRNREHDIGFALEPITSLNRDLCISNKLLDYLRSGLMVVATNTLGHQLITTELSGSSISYTSGDSISLANELLMLIENPNRISIAKQKSLQLAKEKYNWTLQSKEFIQKVINELH